MVSTAHCGSRVVMYNNLTSRTHTLLTFEQAYNLVASNYKVQTDTIVSEIRANGKSDYCRRLKLQVLPAICFSLNAVSRHDNIPLNNPALHTSIINLDIDDASKDVLERAKAIVSTHPCVVAVAYSVSGSITGSFWANISVEIPSTKGALPVCVADLCPSDRWVEALHKLFYKLAKLEFEKLVGETCIGAASDMKRARILAHDPEVVIKKATRKFTVADLAKAIELGELSVDPIVTSTYVPNVAFSELNDDQLEKALSLAMNFARGKGFDFIDGSHHLFQVQLAIKLNLLGVSADEAETLIKTYFPRNKYGGIGNAVSYTYKKYSNNWGLHSTELSLVTPNKTRTYKLKNGEKISCYSTEIADAILTDKKLIIKAGTGTGKTTALSGDVADILIKNGYKCVFVEPVNILATQVASLVNTLPLTASIFGNEDFNEIISQDKIVVNYATFYRLFQHMMKEEIKFIPFIDESHVLEQAVWYKDNGESYNITKALDSTDFTVFFSATPTLYKLVDGYTLVNFEQEERPNINVVPISYKGNQTNAALQFIKQHSSSTDILLLRVNSKKCIETIKKGLKATYQSNEVLCIYSSDKVKNSNDFRQLAECLGKGNSFRNKVKIVLTTSLIDCGLSIYDETRGIISAFFTDYKHDLQAFTQFADRHRTTKSKNVYYLYNDCSLEKALLQAKELDDKERIERLESLILWRSKDFDDIEAYKKETLRYTDRVSNLNTETLLYGRDIDTSKSDNCIVYNYDKKLFEVSKIGVAAKIEQQKIKHRSFDRFKTELAKYFILSDKSEIENDALTVLEGKSAQEEIYQEEKEFDSKLKEALLSCESDKIIGVVGEMSKSKKVKSYSRAQLSSREQRRHILSKYPFIEQNTDRAVLICERIIRLDLLGVNLAESINHVWAHERKFSSLEYRLIGRYILENTNLSAVDSMKKKQIGFISDYLDECIGNDEYFMVGKCRLFIGKKIQETSIKRYKTNLCTISNYEILQYAKAICSLNNMGHNKYKIGNRIFSRDEILSS